MTLIRQLENLYHSNEAEHQMGEWEVGVDPEEPDHLYARFGFGAILIDAKKRSVEEGVWVPYHIDMKNLCWLEIQKSAPSREHNELISFCRESWKIAIPRKFRRLLVKTLLDHTSLRDGNKNQYG